MSYQIKQCTTDDIGFVSEQLTALCDIHHKGRSDVFKAGGCKYTASDIITLINQNDAFIDICVNNDSGKQVGYCIQFLKQTTEDSCRLTRKVLFIDDLCISDKQRSKGAGSAMMAAVKQRATELCCDSIELNVWEFNKSAIAFYEKLGYKLQKRIYEVKL